MSYEFYKFTHLIALVILSIWSTYGYIYRLFLGELEGRKKKVFVRVYMLVLLLFLISGFGLLAKLQIFSPANFSWAIWTKIAVWVVIGFFPSIIAKANISLVKISGYALIGLLLLNIYLGSFWKTL